MKRPAFQFYPKDWMSDLRLRSCSAAGRGLWADLMCLMHDGQPYGHLSLDGVAMDDETAARMTGLTVKEYRAVLTEIETRGVSSRTPAGVLFSRRMVKDQAIREVRAESGQKGGKFAQAKIRASGRGNSEQSTEQTTEVTVAAADADADGVVLLEKGSGEKPSGPILGRLVNRLSGHPRRFAVIDFLTEHLPDDRNLEGWAGHLIGCLDGITLKNGKAVTVEELAAACLEYPGIENCGWSPDQFLATVERTARRLRRPDLPSGPAQALSKIEKARADFLETA